jgi:hypothetical protein
MRFVSILLLTVLSAGCAGYRLGPTNGLPAGVRTVQVSLFRNDTLEPRLSEAVGTALRRTLQQDGTYRLETREAPDVIVSGVLTHYDRDALSFQRFDVITARDLDLLLTAHVTAVERISGRVLLDQPVTGRTSMRILADQNMAERQAVPLLAEDLARNISALLVDGTW